MQLLTICSTTRYITGWQGNGRGIWVDATFVNDVWQWRDGSMRFNWAVGEPNGVPSHLVQCIQLYRNGTRDWGYRFDDLPCSYVREFACEKPLV